MYSKGRSAYSLNLRNFFIFFCQATLEQIKNLLFAVVGPVVYVHSYLLFWSSVFIKVHNAAEDKIALDYSQNTQNETAPLPNMQNDSSAKYAARNCRLLQNKRNNVQ
jgi:hypothetical protein